MSGAGSWRALGLGRRTQAAALHGSQAINRASLPERLAGTSLESQSPSASGVPPCPCHSGHQSGMPEMIPRGAGPLGAEGPSIQDILKADTWLTAPLCLLRAHRNDMETIYPFLFLGFVYSFLGPNPFIARMHFLVFFLGRMIHTVAYLGKLRAPTRSLAYTLAQLPCASMALQIVWEAARHL